MKDAQSFTFQQSVILKTVVPLLILGCTSYTRFGNVLLKLTKFQNFHMVDSHAIELCKPFSEHQTMHASKRSSTGCFGNIEARGGIEQTCAQFVTCAQSAVHSTSQWQNKSKRHQHSQKLDELPPVRLGPTAGLHHCPLFLLTSIRPKAYFGINFPQPVNEMHSRKAMRTLHISAYIQALSVCQQGLHGSCGGT